MTYDNDIWQWHMMLNHDENSWWSMMWYMLINHDDIWWSIIIYSAIHECPSEKLHRVTRRTTCVVQIVPRSLQCPTSRTHQNTQKHHHLSGIYQTSTLSQSPGQPEPHHNCPTKSPSLPWSQRSRGWTGDPLPRWPEAPQAPQGPGHAATGCGWGYGSDLWSYDARAWVHAIGGSSGPGSKWSQDVWKIQFLNWKKGWGGFWRLVLGWFFGSLHMKGITTLPCFLLHPSWRILWFLDGRPSGWSNQSCPKRLLQAWETMEMMLWNYFDHTNEIKRVILNATTHLMAVRGDFPYYWPLNLILVSTHGRFDYILHRGSKEWCLESTLISTMHPFDL